MRPTTMRHLSAALLMVAPAGLAVGDDPQPKPAPATPATAVADEPGVGLLDAVGKGDVSVQAQGAGPGRITVRVTNNTNRRLRIVLPPGLIASGATGQMGGMGGGMGGGGMGGGGMGGGMGGGGMGGGFRSVPPTDLPNAMLQPGQTRDLNTRIVSLRAPGADGAIASPEQGEALELGDASQFNVDPRLQAALRRLARDKAPDNISQLVLWATAGVSWVEIARLSESWANPHELALAKQLVSQLDADPSATADTGRLLIDFVAKTDAQQATTTELQGLFAKRLVLGLKVENIVPDQPTGPSVACRVQVQGTIEKPEALVQLATSDARGTAWTATGKFTLPLPVKEGKVDGVAFGDALAEELLKRLVKVAVKHPSAQASGMLVPRTAKQHDKVAYTVQIDNYSPLMLNGIAVVGTEAKESEPLRILAGIALSPRRRMSLPVSGPTAEAFGLKTGVKVMALDLSGL